MTQNQRRRRGSNYTRPLVIGALTLFVLVDAALVGYALLGQGKSPSSDAYTPVPIASATDDSTEAGDAATFPAPTATQVALVSPSTYLSVVDESVAYRATAGTCSPTARPVLEKSVDGGSTWTASTITTDLSSVFRLQAVDRAYAYAVGLGGSSCVPGVTATYTSGAGFQTYPDRVATTWYLDPGQPAIVHSPVGSAAAPCAAGVALAPADGSNAALLCSDGVIHRTTDSGVSWDAGTTIPSAVSIDSQPGGYVVAGRRTEACGGVAVLLLDMSSAESVPAVVGCADEAFASVDEFAPIVIAAGAGSVWIQLGDAVAVSADGGRTF